MDKRLVMAFVLFSLMLFGCTGQKGAAASGTTSGTGAAGGTGTGTSNAVQDLTGKNYTQLAALGVPIECDVAMTYQGQTTTWRMYMKGESSRVEVAPPTGDACRTKYIFISDKNDMYMGCEGGSPDSTGSGVQCDWVQLISHQGNASASSQASGSPELSSVPSSSFNCKPWAYDASMLAAPTTNVCDINSIIASQPQGIPG
jgi:hypothetical protein